MLDREGFARARDRVERCVGAWSRSPVIPAGAVAIEEHHQTIRRSLAIKIEKLTGCCARTIFTQPLAPSVGAEGERRACSAEPMQRWAWAG
jgi:hypothetical protein